ncbi:hypothetical protein ABGT22_25395 [Peribacillus frigoritolerans]|uniref:hypothetical protein n=1 Tax=Peribacillus frigoritolerans TaxID=450367 RepID=UPI00345D0971
MLFNRDCIFYKYTGEPNWNNISIKQGDDFSSFSYEQLEGNIIKANFEWIDPIKIRDKIISTKKKNIMFLIFLDKQILTIFGSSESSISYTITKIQQMFPITLEKVNIFLDFKSKLSIKKKEEFTVTSIDINKTPLGFETIDYVNIALKNLTSSDLEEIKQSQKILSLVIYLDLIKIYFSIDFISVISFFDTDEFDSIYNACKRIVNYIG